MKRKAFQRKGFTLLEALLATAISLMLLGGLYVVVDLQVNSTQNSRDAIQQATLARALMDRISRDMLSSITIKDPGPFRSGQLSYPTDESSDISTTDSSSSSSSTSGGTSTGTGSTSTGSTSTGTTGGSSKTGSTTGSSGSSGSSKTGSTSGSTSSGSTSKTGSTSSGSSSKTGSTSSGSTSKTGSTSGSASSGSSSKTGSTSGGSSSSGSAGGSGSSGSSSSGTGSSSSTSSAPDAEKMLFIPGIVGTSDQITTYQSVALPKVASGNSINQPSGLIPNTNACGIKRISYWVVGQGDQSQGLARWETTAISSPDAINPTAMPSDVEEHIIAPEVKSMKVSYSDGSAGNWSDFWDSRSLSFDSSTPQGPPRAMKIELEMLAADGKTIRHYSQVVAIPVGNTTPLLQTLGTGN